MAELEESRMAGGSRATGGRAADGRATEGDDKVVFRGTRVDRSGYPAVDRAALAEHYANPRFGSGFARLCRMVLPRGREFRGLTALDLGCRSGKGVYKLSECVGGTGRAIGVDWNEASIEHALAHMESAWRKTGLARCNMEFHLGYPEDLRAVGIADESVDLVYVNSVANLFYDRELAFREMARVLAPGGQVCHDAVLASSARNPGVVNGARALGNSVQAAPSREEFEALAHRVGLTVANYSDASPVTPETGETPDRPAVAVPSGEDVRFESVLVILEKPE